MAKRKDFKKAIDYRIDELMMATWLCSLQSDNVIKRCAQILMKELTVYTWNGCR
jgi:hypothetical protein